MANIETHYSGLKLKNPLIFGSSNYVTNLDNAKKLEDAGASAIVYKSLFEEQIILDKIQHQAESEENDFIHAEIGRIFPQIEHAGPEEHLLNLEKLKKSLSIPVIGSLNAINSDSWLEYAKLLEKTGIDALELNFYSVPLDHTKSAKEIEDEMYSNIKKIKDAIQIPVSVKLSPYFTNVFSVVKEIDTIGVDAVVLFNNFFQPDIDIDSQKHIIPYKFSAPSDIRHSLRYAGILYNEINAEICASNGVYSAKDVIKLILAGANTVQIVSAVYRQGPELISKILNELEEWMLVKNYNSIDDFRGILSKKEIKDPYVYKRAQYVDILMHT